MFVVLGVIAIALSIVLAVFGGGGLPSYGSSGGSGGASAAAPAMAAPPAAEPGPASPGAQRFTIVSEQSEATYHARQEVFVPGLGADVDGSTHNVSGSIDFNPQHPSQSRINTVTVQVDTLTSGIGLRDQRLHGEFLESDKFPIATFTGTRVEGLSDTPYQDGQELHFKVVGDLTIHGVTRPVTFDATATVSGATLTGTAQTTVAMPDFGITVPDLLNFVQAEPTVGLELAITAQRA